MDGGKTYYELIKNDAVRPTNSRVVKKMTRYKIIIRLGKVVVI